MCGCCWLWLGLPPRKCSSTRYPISRIIAAHCLPPLVGTLSWTSIPFSLYPLRSISTLLSMKWTIPHRCPAAVSANSLICFFDGAHCIPDRIPAPQHPVKAFNPAMIYFSVNQRYAVMSLPDLGLRPMG